MPCREVNKGDNKEAVFDGLFPGGQYTVTIVTVVGGPDAEVISAPSRDTFRIREFFFFQEIGKFSFWSGSCTLLFGPHEQSNFLDMLENFDHHHPANQTTVLPLDMA